MKSMNRGLIFLSALAMALSAQAGDIQPPTTCAITNPAPGQAFEAGVTNVTIGWTESLNATSYNLQVLRNSKLFASQDNIPGQEAVLDSPLAPGYYSLIVYGSNFLGVSTGSAPVTFRVKRDMAPDGTVSNRQSKVFRWTRSTPATRYQFRLAQLNKATGKYVLVRELWIAQPATGAPKWTASLIPDGQYRWTLTDYKNDKAGYTQSALFKIKDSGHTTWNDASLIEGKWKVLTSWRWVQLTFRPDGVIQTVQGNGQAFTRAHWSADEKLLTMVSDVTEKCPYTVTENTLTFTLPSGNIKQLVRVP